MPEKTFIIKNKVGLHARPASLFVKTAAKFKSTITVTHGEASSTAKSILGVLSLSVAKDSKIVVNAEGADAEEALAALQTLIENDFGEA